MKKTTTLASLLIFLVLLSGCGLGFNAAAASSTPTIVPLAANTEAAATPTPAATATPIPPPSATPVPATPAPAATEPEPAAASPTPVAVAAAPSPAAKPVVNATAAPQPAVVSNSTLNGEWDFTFGTMSLTQRGSRVEGTYQWYGGLDTGRIEGIVVDEMRQFQGLWVSDRSPNSQGLLSWQIDPDWAGFSGSFTGARGGQWCGVRSGLPLPAGCGLSGTWQLRFGNPPDQTGQATLVQTGPTVSGTYTNSQGGSGEIVAATIAVQSLTETTLTGTWQNDAGQQDAFEWRLDLTTGRTFQGRRDPGNSEWCGWREGGGPPEQCGW